jgi:cation:H+ antiporter
MFEVVTTFVALAVVIVFAGTFLARYADALGELTGMGRSLAGLVLLAMATSLPELATDCSAALIGAIDLAAGDLLGSCLFNLLILGMLDMMFRSRGRMLSPQAAAHALGAITSILLTSIALLFILWRIDASVVGVGVGTIVIAACYLFCLRWVYADHRYGRSDLMAPAVESPDVEQYTLRHATIGYLVTTAVIFAAAPLLARTAENLAVVSGLGGTFVGTTLLALTTSLPELVTTAAALRMGSFDMAVGNIFGSNSFNIAIMFGVDACYRDGALLASISATHAVTAVAVIIVTSIATMGLLYRAEKRYWLIEPDAVLVIVLVLAALGLVYQLR